MMSIFNVWSKGRKYLETWPLESKLGMIFPENRIIRATKFAQNIMPMFAVFALCWPYFYGYSLMTTSASLLTALAALCLPFTLARIILARKTCHHNLTPTKCGMV